MVKLKNVPQIIADLRARKGDPLAWNAAAALDEYEQATRSHEELARANVDLGVIAKGMYDELDEAYATMNVVRTALTNLIAIKGIFVPTFHDDMIQVSLVHSFVKPALAALPECEVKLYECVDDLMRDLNAANPAHTYTANMSELFDLLMQQPEPMPSGATIRCRKCGDTADITFKISDAPL